ncbi:phosphorelay protein [Caenispirillum salinarum]|uniref:phosphorelay protein n=1 Tax=Caenispirillum salinarum TaxID=859058 RepID=UPI003850A60F
MSSEQPEFIQPPDTLKDKVDVTAGGVDLDALEKAEALIAGLQGDYLSWVEGDLEKLQEFYKAAETADPADRREKLRDVFSVAHDVKGQGGSFNYHLMTTIANQLCRFIEKLPEQVSKGQMEVVKVHIDALRLVIAQRLEGDGGRAGSNLVRGLDAVINKVRPAEEA